MLVVSNGGVPHTPAIRACHCRRSAGGPRPQSVARSRWSGDLLSLCTGQVAAGWGICLARCGRSIVAQFSICRIADLQSAERRIRITHRSFPTPRRVQLCEAIAPAKHIRTGTVRGPAVGSGCARATPVHPQVVGIGARRSRRFIVAPFTALAEFQPGRLIHAEAA